MVVPTDAAPLFSPEVQSTRVWGWLDKRIATDVATNAGGGVSVSIALRTGLVDPFAISGL